MYEILMRLKIMRNDKIYEVYLDERLSFSENFVLLNELINEHLIDVKVYDPIKKLFLNTEIALKEFNIESFRLFYLF